MTAGRNHSPDPKRHLCYFWPDILSLFSSLHSLQFWVPTFVSKTGSPLYSNSSGVTNITETSAQNNVEA